MHFLRFLQCLQYWRGMKFKDRSHTNRRSERRDTLVLAGAAGSGAAAVLHLAILPFGADGLRYFGAGERLAAAADRGSPVPTITAGGIAAALGMASWVAVAQVGHAPASPGQRHLYAMVTAVYLARGIALLPQLVLRAAGVDVGPSRELVFSAIALGLGLLHVAGLDRRDVPDRERALT